jgi:hypothetical protein
MRRLGTKLALVFLFLTFASPAFATTCLKVGDIVSAQSQDGKVLEFHMRDGQTLINHLQGSCPGLKFNGFEWTVHVDTVCENMQTLRVLHSGETCVLGKFESPTSQSRG